MQQSSNANLGNIKVCCRVRPTNDKEKKDGQGLVCIDVKGDQCIVVNSSNGTANPKDRTFFLDKVFPMETTQSEVYEYAAKPIVSQLFKGFNGTVLAYGQTSSGKTHTMEGNVSDQDYMGVIPRMVNHVFTTISAADEHIEFQLKVSMCEVYMEHIRDLLDTTGKKNNLKIHEDKNKGIYVQDLTEFYVSCPEEVFEIMSVGHKHRSVAATNMNAYSSRSHLIFILQVHQKNTYDHSVKMGKLFLVDLAGSEKVTKTGAEGLTLDEAKMINKSLSCLGNVINSLTEANKQHVPYRDSKLTRILQESLGGNSLTCLIVTCSPSILNESETVSTLRFGIRAKMVKNAPKVNLERSKEELEMLLKAAEKKIADKDIYISSLEQLLLASGGELPSKEQVMKIAAQENLNKFTTITNERSAINVDDDSTDSELQDAKERLKEQSELISEMQNKQNEFINAIDELAKQKSELESRISELQTDLDALKYEKHDQTDAIQQLEILNSNLEVEIENYKKEVDVLKLNNPSEKLVLSSMSLSLANDTKDIDINKTIYDNDVLKKQLEVLNQFNLENCDNMEEWIIEKFKIIESLNELTKKNAKLEVSLKNEKEKIQRLREFAGNSNEKSLLCKMTQLDANLEQLTVLYQKLVTQNATLKSECQLHNKRMKRKEERINYLEKSLIDSKSKYQKLLQQCTALTSTIDQFSKLKPAFARGIVPNIARSLKGGTSSTIADLHASLMVNDKSNTECLR